jgi:hypothetical protein
MGVRRPSGPYRIASFLREHDWDIEVIEYACTFTLEELKEVVRARATSQTIFVGFSSFFSYWEPKLDEFVDWLKLEYPGVATIFGGQSRPRLKTNGIDYYIHGYGEVAILELVKYIVGTPGVKIAFDPAFFGSKRVISANTTHPAYPMKSLRIKYEDRDDIQSWEWLTIEFSRGCKFQCAYCNFPILGVKGDYSRDAEDFEIEMRDNYERWGIKNYYVADETFNDRSEKIEKFAQVVDRLDFKPHFSGFIRADLLVLRKQDWEPLARLGMFGHFCGVETMNPQTAKAIGKGMNPVKLREGLIEAGEYFKSRGNYRCSMGIVVGLPYETKESQMETLKWVEENWQGQSVHVWPLEIPLDPTQDVLSKVSKDYNGYGYRESTVPVPEPRAELMMMPSQIRVKHGISNLNWANDHMNYADACEISNEFYWRVYKREMTFGVAMFGLGDYTYPDIPLEKVLTMNGIDMPTQTHERTEEYKRKKLNK